MRIHKTFALTLLAGLVSLAATAQTANELVAKVMALPAQLFSYVLDSG